MVRSPVYGRRSTRPPFAICFGLCRTRLRRVSLASVRPQVDDARPRSPGSSVSRLRRPQQSANAPSISQPRYSHPDPRPLHAKNDRLSIAWVAMVAIEVRRKIIGDRCRRRGVPFSRVPSASHSHFCQTVGTSVDDNAFGRIYWGRKKLILRVAGRNYKKPCSFH